MNIFRRVLCRTPIASCPVPWVELISRLDKIEHSVEAIVARLSSGADRMDSIEERLAADMSHGRAMADALQVHMLREETDIGAALADMRRLIAIYERRASP